MSCSTYRNNLRPWLRGELPEADAATVENHVAGCYPCARIVENESAILDALQSRYRVPEPSADFESRVMAAATRQSPAAGHRRLLSFPVAGGAVAAALVLGIALGIGLQPEAPTGTAFETTNAMAGNDAVQNNARTVRFAFNAAEAMDNVTLTVELPAHVEMSDYPGHQKLSWNVSLDQGENIVKLPLNILFPGEGELVARLDDGERGKTFRTRLSQFDAQIDAQTDEGRLPEPVL